MLFLNDRLVSIDDAQVCALDRGYLFGDGLYAVLMAQQGIILDLAAHIERLAHQCACIQLCDDWSIDDWKHAIDQVIAANPGQAHHIYCQITRGNYGYRQSAWDTRQIVPPTRLIQATPFTPPSRQTLANGFAAILCEDPRDQLCHLKSTARQANVLLSQQAKIQGVLETLLFREGLLTEGYSSNVFIVSDNVLCTPALSNQVLDGVTRAIILACAEAHHLKTFVGPIEESRVVHADEIWVTGTTKSICPITTLNGQRVGTGQPGPWWHTMIDLYHDAHQHQIKEGLCDLT